MEISSFYPNRISKKESFFQCRLIRLCHDTYRIVEFAFGLSAAETQETVVSKIEGIFTFKIF